MEAMLATNQQTSPDKACPASRSVSWPAETVPENPQASYYRARYYDPISGRFLNEDPAGFQSGDMNFYAYVFNFPTGWIDPFGLTEGSPGNLAKRKAISNNATNAVGSNNFDFARNGGSQYPANSWKCSQFVCSNVSKA